MAVQTEAQFDTRIANALADNTTGAISEGVLRAFITDLTDSLAFRTAITDFLNEAGIRALSASTAEAGTVQLGSSADLRTDANRGRAAQVGSVYTVVREWLANLVAVPTISGSVLTFTDFDGDTHDVTLPAGTSDTAAELLVKLLTVDGAGSGLDADLLDGMTPAEVAALASGGFTLRFGAAAPANSLGANGDWYLRTSNGQWLERVSGVWTSRYTDQLGTSGGGQTEAQVNTLVQAALAAAVSGNTETGISVTYNADGTLDFVVGAVAAHDLIVGWSADTTISDTELAAGASPVAGGAHNVATLPTGSGNQYLFVWRSTADGGDPSEVHIAGGGNQRNIFGSATARTYNGTAGQLIVSVTTQNVSFLGGEQVRVV